MIFFLAWVSVHYTCSQAGFGLYPVIVKKFAAHEETNPVIFSFYRQVPIAQ